MNNWHQSLTATVGVLPALLGSFFSPVGAIDLQGINSLKPQRTFVQSQQPLESSNTCQQVAAKGSGLYVREEPTVYSQALAILPDGQNVAVENGGTEHWASISAPLSGYVFRGFLAPCQSSATTTFEPPQPLESSNTCQQVAAKGSGLYVQEEPTVYSQALAILPDGQNVAVENDGTEHWVSISAPLAGYVFRGFLAPCQSSATTTD